MNYRCHTVLISSYVFADAQEDHPLVTSDSPVLILLHGNKMQGLDGMFNGSRSDRTLPLKDDKYHSIRFRVRQDYLSGFKAHDDNIRTCDFEQVFFDRALPGKFYGAQEIYCTLPVTRKIPIHPIQPGFLHGLHHWMMGLEVNKNYTRVSEMLTPFPDHRPCGEWEEHDEKVYGRKRAAKRKARELIGRLKKKQGKSSSPVPKDDETIHILNTVRHSLRVCTGTT
jgi:hypothetical protein